MDSRDAGASTPPHSTAQHSHRGTQGLKSCKVTDHNLLHLLEDVERFSSPDNYWCFPFEQVVNKYIEWSSNKKNIEHTFAKAESQREFLKFFREQSQPRDVISDLSAGELVSFLATFHVQFYSFYTLPLILIQVCASSIKKAQQVARVHPLLSTPGVLVGRHTYLALSSKDRVLLCQCTSENWPEDVIVSHFRSKDIHKIFDHPGK